MTREDRYFVDERAGCIAIRDSSLTSREGPGLHHEMESVVWYRAGVPKTERCATCGHERYSGYMIPDSAVRLAHEECRKLNAAAAYDPIEMGA